MENMERNKLICGQAISLSPVTDGCTKEQEEQYEIRSVIGEGGSSVCYEAVRIHDGMAGKLKEFYPAGHYPLKRNVEGQLVQDGGARQIFSDMCQEYIGSYHLLHKIIGNNPDNQVLKNYIQNFQILYGIPDGDEKATVYVWSLGIEGKGFDKYLSEIRKDPARHAGRSLNNILRATITLTDCIRALHMAGLMHLDIKPSNFLVSYDSYHNINTGNISLFDINTLRSVDGTGAVMAGTNGYQAPELSKGKADNRSDIYSIGALLFNAIVVSDHIPDGLYSDSHYNDIEQLVKHSKLIVGSEASFDIYLTSKLSDILKKCLARDPEKRYASCGQLLDDIKCAERLSIPYSDIQGMIGQNRRLAIVEKNEQGADDPRTVIQKLLHDHPLYEAIDGNVEKLHVLVVGSGCYGQEFIDACLQSGQMEGCSLTVTAVSNDPKGDMEMYLRFRPAIKRFVDINGSMGEKDAYGKLDFLPLEDAAGMVHGQRLSFSHADAVGNEKLVSGILSNAMEKGNPYDYVFVALGDGELNHSVAKTFAGKVHDLPGASCTVCYINDDESGGEVREWAGSMPYPASTHAPYITQKADDLSLEQMAFNVHISWYDSINIDVQETWEKFRENKYEHSSSLACVLSIPYKLRSIGIQTDSLQEAAERFFDEILDRRATDPEAEKKFQKLVALEHRRWVLYMAADGWDAPLDEDGRLALKSCVENGCIRNEAEHTHPCMVESSANTPLHGSEYLKGKREKWDDPNIDPGLDELDHMSVELHQYLRDAADEFKRTNPLQGGDLVQVRELAFDGGEQSVKAYKQFESCLKNILDGSESYTREFDNYNKQLSDSLGSLPKDAKEKVKGCLNSIKKAYFPMIEANLYRNYKENDEKLVGKIPFILSFRFPKCIAMAFEDGRRQNGRNEAVFANVAAATVTSPGEICYLYYYDKDSSSEPFTQKVSAVLNYLGQRNVHCKVTIAIACSSSVSDEERERMREDLERIRSDTDSQNENAKLQGYKILSCQDSADGASQLIQYLNGKHVDLYDGSTELFGSPLDNGIFISKIVGSGIPYFEFDWKRKEFTKLRGCGHMKFIRDGSCIRIHDMFALMNAGASVFKYPEFADDYKVLWELYTGKYLSFNQFEFGVVNWNRLCDALELHEKRQQPLAIIPVNHGLDRKNKRMSFLLPEYAFHTAKRILADLASHEVIREEYSLSTYTSESCRIELEADMSLEGEFARLFSNPHLFLRYYGMDVQKTVDYSGEYVRVTCNNLSVSRADLAPNGNEKHAFYSYILLDKLQEAGFISQLVKDEKDPRFVSFQYSAPRIKKLLTCSGEMLEIYTFYRVLETGYFDDVECGYEFQWEDGRVKNELDLVLTKGFRSIIVECKATQKLKLEFYHKLHSIAEHFGIGTIKVLVGNIHGKDFDGSNDMQCSRGNLLHIHTITSQEQIQDIGNTLVRLMENHA